MSFDFDGALKDAEKSGLVSGGDRFKIQEGPNRIRLLTNPLPFEGSYEGRPNFKWLVYILDRSDGQVKLFFMPHTIFKTLRDYQKSEDYSFEGCPMPYDVTINAKNAGKKEVEYTLIPSPKRTALTEADLEKLSAKKPIAEVKAALAAKEMEKAAASTLAEHGSNGSATFDPDEIPF